MLRICRSHGDVVHECRFLNTFTHIFSGGYASGYYGYKWWAVAHAKVLGPACDVKAISIAQTKPQHEVKVMRCRAFNQGPGDVH